MSRLLTLFLAVSLCTSFPSSFYGTLRAPDELAISNSVTNLNEIADFTFRFVPDTAIPASGTLDIQFPTQFTLGLGLPSPPVCSNPCTLFNRTITVQFSTAVSALTEKKVIVYNVLNPSQAGGTAFFLLKSWAGSNLLDVNLAFGVIGVERAVTAMTTGSVRISSTTSTKAGEVGSYMFSFKPNRFLPAYSWLRFTFPNNGFALSQYPSCQTFAVNGKAVLGTLSCVTTGRKVQLTGISEDTQAGTEIGIAVTATNPPQSGVTDYFSIETGRNRTNSVYERISSVQGVTITPGRINAKYFSQTDPNVMLTRGNQVMFTMKITPTNPIEVGGTIRVQFNNNFNMDSTPHYWVNYGLDDLSSTQPVTWAYATTTQTFTISNFAAFSPKEISLQLELTNSILTGLTPTLIVETRKADGLTVIDQDTTIAVTILDMTKPAITYTLTSNLATGSNVGITFKIVPNLAIPALGYVKVYMPKGFSASTPYPTCNSTPKNISTASAMLCTIVDGLLTFQLFGQNIAPGVLQPGSGEFRASLDSLMDIPVGILAPVEPGYYVFNFMTYDQKFGLLESSTCGITMQANLFAAYTFDTVHTQINTPTIMKIIFTPINPVPQASPQSSISDKRGFLEVRFPTMDASGNLLFAPSLGLTQSYTNAAARSQGSTIPCKGIQSIAAVYGYTLNCVLTTVPATASANNYVIVTVANFDTLKTGVVVELHFAGITHVQTANIPSLTVTTYYTQNRRRTDLNTRQAALASTPANTAAAQTSAVAFTSTVLTVGTASTFAGSINTVTALPGAATNAFLVYMEKTHDNGYCDATVALVCKVNLVIYACLCESQADMIYIPVGTVGYTAGTTYSLSLVNLFNPGSVPPTADTVRVYTISNGALKDNIQYTTAMPMQVVGIPAYNLVTPTSTALSQINNKFSFKIQAGHSIAAGGTITIGFPSRYSLHTSTPACTCSVSLPFALTAAGVGCSLFGTAVTITNFQAVGALGTILVDVNGVKNPSTGTTSGYFSVTTYSPDGYLIDYTTSVPGFTFSAVVPVGGLTISSLTAFPTNARADSEIVIQFSLTNPIPKGGVIVISFPSAQYPQLPASVSLKLAGGLISFSSFVLSGSQLKVTTDADSSGESVTVYVLGMTNSDEGTTGYFAVSTVYDGVTLCQSGTQAVIQVPRAALALTVDSWDFYPRNEGEKATYTFTVIPKLDISLDQVILLSFPASYDKRIGDSLQCASDYLPGLLNCTVPYANVVQVSGHEGFLVCDICRFTLSLYNVGNPAAGRQGYLSLGVLNTNSTFSEFLPKIGPVTTVTAPGYNNLWQVTPSSLSSRMINNIDFNMTTSQSIPQSSSGGAVWLVFPSDYDLGGAGLVCYSSKYWSNGVPDCSLYYDTVILSGQEFDYLGTLIVTIQGVPNPLYEVLSGSVIAKTYDNQNRKVLDSSYYNTNPNQLQYKYPGPLIVVNNDKPIISIRGSMTSAIPVDLYYPCALNITLVPVVGDFCIIPYHVDLYIGQMGASFRVSVPLYLASGVYYIKWSLSGEVYPPYYTPVATSKLIVQSARNIPVSIDPLGIIPQHGTSLPIRVSVPNAPDLNITITLALPDNYPGLHLNATVLEFTRGVTQNFFALTTDNYTKLATAEITVELTGPSSGIYLLRSNKLEFSVSTQNGAAPMLSSVSSQTITRATASFRFSVSRPCMVFYESALRGTSPPSFDRVHRSGPALWDSSKSQFGSLAVRSVGTFAVMDLTAGTKYTVFLWAEDLEHNRSPSVVSHDFETTPIYRSAQSSLSFQQTFMTKDEIDNAFNAVRLLLSLDIGRLLFNAVTPSSTSSRRLSTASSVLEFYIIDDPSSDVYPTPKVLGDLLATKSNQLSTMLNSFDPTWVIAGNEVIIGQCRFQQTPDISANHSTVRVTAQLADAGYVYGICVEASSGYPSSMQVSKGLDAANAPAPSFQVRVPGKYSTSHTFTGLNPSTVYKVYITCGNIYPGASELLPDSKVVSTSLKTKNPPDPVPIILKTALWQAVPLLVSLALL